MRPKPTLEADVTVINGPVSNAPAVDTYWYPSVIYSVSMENGIIVTSPDKYPVSHPPIMPAASLYVTLANSARECWLALTDDESSVVGRGDTPAEALAEARQAGVDDPILVWAPKKWP